VRAGSAGAAGLSRRRTLQLEAFQPEATMRHPLFAVLALVALTLVGSLVAGCRSAQGDTVADKRNSVNTMRDETLTRLYRERPEAKAKLAGAAGYGVFSSLGMKLVFASGNGYGVVHDNAGGGDTYMQMQELGVGLGLGVKDTRIVIVFHNRQAMTDFTEKGWEWAGNADASAESGGTGAGANLGVSANTGTQVYVLTEAGVAVQATVTGTKYWKDSELNGR
jgi:lipid-binding SYLF domain-containing protein